MFLRCLCLLVPGTPFHLPFGKGSHRSLLLCKSLPAAAGEPSITIVLTQALDSKLSLETAMALYGLEHSELFWEKALDTKLLMAWNRNTIVMAFRGTASFANALADLQVCLLLPQKSS